MPSPAGMNDGDGPQQDFADTCIELPDFAGVGAARRRGDRNRTAGRAGFRGLRAGAAGPGRRCDRAVSEPTGLAVADTAAEEVLHQPSPLDDGFALDIPVDAVEGVGQPGEAQPPRAVAAGDEADESEALEVLPSTDEAIKVIEHLRIGIPLYNVYLNEAD